MISGGASERFGSCTSVVMGYKLWGMSSLRWIGAVTIPTLILGACRGERKAPPLDTTASQAVESTAVSASDTTSSWDTAVGPFLAVMTDSGSAVVSIVGGADSTVDNPAPLALDLFGRSGLIGTSTLAAGISDGEGDCTTWPVGHLGTVRSGWSVGVASGRAVPIPLDSLEAMRSTDSSQFVAEVIRIASGLKVTHDPVFSSVPFVVERAYRFRTESLDGLVALVQRNIPTEADPRSDYTMFIAERPIGSTDPYRIAFEKRTAGREDQTVVVSVLAAVTLVKTHQLVLIVRYEMAEGSTIGLIERARPGAWKATWTSDYAGC